jgi:peptidoglycan/xylan/chitin deacetylase (PgdA/CDA1 family)
VGNCWLKTHMRAVPTVLLRRSPLQPLSRLAGRNQLRVLAYHDVKDPFAFEQQLDHLLEHYTPIDLDRILHALGGGELPPRSVLITFDDGHRSWVDHAAPAMQRRGIPGVVFVVTGVLGSEVPYWWEEMTALRANGAADIISHLKRIPDAERLAILEAARRLAAEQPTTNAQLAPDDLKLLEAAGLEVGNHTVTHPLLDQCEPTKIAREIGEAKEVLEGIVGHPVRSFAYPNGNSCAEARRQVAGVGHVVAFLFDHASQHWPPSDALSLSRIRVNADPLDTFAIRVSGLHPAVHRLRRRP